MRRDNSEDRYRFYRGLADCGNATRHLVEEFLPQHYAIHIAKLAYGFELEMPNQCARDVRCWKTRTAVVGRVQPMIGPA
jgi:hypothetical protein